MDLVTGQLNGDHTGTLTGRELSLLGYLVQRAGVLVSREELTVRAFGYSPHAQTRAVDKAIHGLRRKVEANPAQPDHLITCHGSGYRFVPLPADEPSADGPLIGRRRELTRLETMVQPGAIITVKGAPGIGKTHLVAELVRRLDEAVPATWIDLDGVHDESQLVGRIGRELGTESAEHVEAALARKGHGLLVLDGGAPDLLLGDRLDQWRTLGSACWIRTAEAPLGHCEEQIVVVDPMSIVESVRLFRQRAERRGYPLADGEAVRRLARWLDGLPLAAVVAADHIGPLGVADLVQGLERRALSLLTWRPCEGGLTLWDRLEASWARLSPGDQHLLAAAVQLDGPIGIDRLRRAAQWPESRVLSGVQRLVEASWLVADRLEGHAQLRVIGPTRRFLERHEDGSGTAGLYSSLVRWSHSVSRSSPALLLQESLAELEATSPGIPSGPAVVTLVELLAPVVHTRVSRVLLRHAAHRPKEDLRQEVEDQVQVVFAKLFADRGRILRAWDPTGGLSLVNWVGRFAQLRTQDAVRRGLRGTWFHDPVDPSYFDDKRSFPHTPEDARAARELWTEARQRVLHDESDAGREMFALLFDDERSIDDVVTQTKRSRASVLKWRSRLRQSIRHELTQLMAEGGHDEA